MTNYDELLEISKTLFSKEDNYITTLSNAAAILNTYLEDINWVGFYLKDQNNDLYLGPFQGKVACTFIKNGKGVCGKSYSMLKPFVVGNVHEFEGHIACDKASNSEIVIPLLKDGYPFGVLDIDSPTLNRFTNHDLKYLFEFTQILEKFI